MSKIIQPGWPRQQEPSLGQVVEAALREEPIALLGLASSYVEAFHPRSQPPRHVLHRCVRARWQKTELAVTSHGKTVLWLVAHPIAQIRASGESASQLFLEIPLLPVDSDTNFIHQKRISQEMADSIAVEGENPSCPSSH